MSKLLQKFKSWYNGLRKTKSLYEKKGIKPYKDWIIMLTSTQVIIIVFALLAYYFYIQIDKGNLFVVDKTTSENEIKINRVLLQKTVDDINFREQTTIETKESKSIPTDPSI